MATKDITDTQVLQACQRMWNEKGQRPWPDAHDRLVASTGQHPKVCMAALERAYGRGLLEFGIGVHRSWLTDKGMALLAEQAANTEKE